MTDDLVKKFGTNHRSQKCLSSFTTNWLVVTLNKDDDK